MAKLRKGYLFKRGKIFYACWFVSGKKMVQSTGQSDRRDAKKELARIMQPYLIQDEITTLQTVKARIEGAKAELVIYDEQRNPPLLISAAWPAYLKHPDHLDSGPQTQAAYESHYGQFRKWMKEKHPAVTALRDVTLEIAGEYVSHLTARGLSANRFNKHVRFLALLFRTLTVPAKLTSNPWLPRWRKRQVANSRRELTKDELCRVCQSAKGEMRMLFALGIYSGLRLGDCATLRWSEVDLHRGMICRIPNKTSRSNPKPVLVPLHRVLAAMLAEIPPDQREEYVIPGIAARYKADAPTLSRSITRHFVDNKVSTVKPGTGGDAKKRAVTEVGFHSLRHTFVSLCREADAPLAVVEAIVGHSNPAMTRHYTHVGALAATQAVAALPSVFGGAKLLPAPAAPQPIDGAAVRTLAEKLGAKNWSQIKAELLALAGGA